MVMVVGNIAVLGWISFVFGLYGYYRLIRSDCESLGLIKRKPSPVKFAWHKYPASLESINWLESDIQSFIILKLRDHLCDHPNAFLFEGSLEGNKMTPRAASKAKALGMESGVPDIRVYLPNHRLISIELKRKSGTVSSEQKKRHKALEALGFPVYVVKAKSPADGWAQVYNILKGYGVR